MKIGITGITGLIGWHLRAYLHGRQGIEVKGATRATFERSESLDEFVAGLDVVVHLAGMNRGDDSELKRVNVQLTDRLIDACERMGAEPQIVFSSSTHIERDSTYGQSKRECAGCLRKWADGHRVSFANLIIPHVFGEFGKPFYNSVVSTFCHQLAVGDNLTVVDDGSLELIHTQQLAARILQAALNQENGDIRVKGVPIKVSELLSRLRRMSDLYRSQTVPDLRNLLDLHLFNTYRSYLFPTFYPVSVELHQDGRGQLFEVVRSLNGGQIFLSTTHPGITRGNHYHMRKMERFLVADGYAVIRIRKLFSCEVQEFQVNGECPKYIDIPSFHTHSIENSGASDLITLFWANEIFDSNDTDTYTEKVLAQ